MIPVSTDELTAALQEVAVYLSAARVTYDMDSVEVALVAERTLQAQACRGDLTNPALMEALCRRVHRNLAMRGVPLGVQMTGDGGSFRPGANDPEIRRLERPYLKMVLG